MGRVVWHFAIACIVLSALTESLPALAYIQTLTPTGLPVRWNGGSVKLNFAGNPGNKTGISDQQYFAAVVRGLQRWNAASGGSIAFDYWQGTDPSIYETNTSFNGLSSIYFVSNTSQGSSFLPPTVLGLTQVWYNTETGEVLEADTVLNDKDFRFTIDPKDTSGYGSGGGGRNRVYIENVITHELGHVLGLSHSGHLQSTMLFMESPEQARLACDEMVGVRAIYPSSDVSSRGTITGSVVSISGSPIFGAHVLAVSRRRGTVLASAITDKQGRYAISALEPGAYFLMAEPYYAGPQALPLFYSSIQTHVCPDGQSFGRTVLTDGTGYKPQPVSVGAGGTTSVERLVVRCSSSGGAAFAAISSGSTSAVIPVIYNGAIDGSGFGATDRLSSAGGTARYALSSLSGHVEIHALSYTLYSPVRLGLALTDSQGNPVAAEAFDQVYSSESGYVNFDAALIADVSPGDYYLEITSSPLNASLYPAGPYAIDTVPFLVVTGSVNEAAPVLSSSIPFNARCRMDENFPAYFSPPGNPPRRSTFGEEQDSGFCGTVRTQGSGSGSGPGLGAIAGWFFPFFLIALITRAMKARIRTTRLARVVESG